MFTPNRLLAVPQFASDLVEVTAKGPRLTAPLPLQLGGTARPRGANLLAGAAAGTPEPPLAVDPKLPWRPNVVSAAGGCLAGEWFPIQAGTAFISFVVQC